MHRLRCGCAAVVALAALLLATTGSPAWAQPASVERPAELREGTCSAPGALVMALANLVVALGDPQGQASAMPVEQSGTVVPYTVPALLEINHIVTVGQSPDAPQTIVACGEIGGTLNPDGTLAVGMVGMNSSGLSGITYFTPNPGFDNTLITILLVSDVVAPAEPSTSASTELDNGAGVSDTSDVSTEPSISDAAG